MWQHIAGPSGADSQDHVIGNKMKHDIGGEGEMEREGDRDKKSTHTAAQHERET